MAKIVVVALCVLLIGYLAYVFISPKPASPPSATSSIAVSEQPAPAATSTTYANSAYGFAFDYPPQEGTSSLAFTGADVHDPTDLNARFEGALAPVGLTVEVDAKAANFSSAYFNDQFKAEKRERANSGLVLSTTTVSVGGSPFFAVVGSGKGKTEYEILIAHGNYIYSLGYTLPAGMHDPAIDAVLSSFRFSDNP